MQVAPEAQKARSRGGSGFFKQATICHRNEHRGDCIALFCNNFEVNIIVATALSRQMVPGHLFLF